LPGTTPGSMHDCDTWAIRWAVHWVTSGPVNGPPWRGETAAHRWCHRTGSVSDSYGYEGVPLRGRQRRAARKAETDVTGSWSGIWGRFQPLPDLEPFTPNAPTFSITTPASP